MATLANSNVSIVNGIRLNYYESGDGPPLLLLHGWPTSSYLWRNIMPELARTRRVIALDLPGFGASDKPLDVTYSFRFFESILDGFLENLGIGETGLAVHDLGGPAGLYWAVQNVERVEKLAILNTLVYPEMSWAVKLFLAALKTPVLRDMLTSSAGLAFALRLGMNRRERITPELRAAMQAPFAERAAREALVRSGTGFNPKGFFVLGQKISKLTCPVKIVYGERDRILLDIAQTVDRLRRDLPQAEITALPDCGHFLQEDDPETVARLLGEFF